MFFDRGSEVAQVPLPLSQLKNEYAPEGVMDHLLRNTTAKSIPCFIICEREKGHKGKSLK
jgi:hypothetical protein